MPPKSHGHIVGNAGEIFKCNFIFSSVSDISEPFGFSAIRRDPLAPFTPRGARKSAANEQPIADCGGVPLWKEQHSRRATVLEASFTRRWTGIRRHQWRDCVERGFRAFEQSKAMAGAILFAPTRQKAEPVLFAIRDGLANVVVLGRPCAMEVLQILKNLHRRPPSP
jgi:hypothetical protein